MSDGAKVLVLMAGLGSVIAIIVWLFRRIFGALGPHDKQVEPTNHTEAGSGSSTDHD